MSKHTTPTGFPLGETGTAVPDAVKTSRNDRTMHRAFRRVLRVSGIGRLVDFTGGRVMSVLAAGVVLFGGGLYLLGSPSAGDHSVASVSGMLGFKPKTLVVNGNAFVDERVLNAALVSEMETSIFTFDAGKARKTLLNNPWLKSVSVSKVYPDTIRLDVVERKPFAFWKSGEVVRVIARDGTVLGDATPEHMRLRQVVGSGANIAAPEFIATISKFPGVSERSKAFVRVGERRWNLVLRNNLTVMLPEHNWREALIELDRLDSKQKIFDRELVRIDMRLPDRLVLRLDETVADKRREQLDALLKRKWNRS